MTVDKHKNGCIPYVARVSELWADLSDPGNTPLFRLQINKLQGGWFCACSTKSRTTMCILAGQARIMICIETNDYGYRRSQ